MGRERASHADADPLRLFVAVEVPEAVRELVEVAAGPIRSRFPLGRWVPRANQHVTLKFLGSTSPPLLGRVESSIERVALAAAAFDARVDGLGAFPGARRARVLWAGLEEGGRMGELAAALDDALSGEVRPEGRAFTPHLTLARFYPPVSLEEASRPSWPPEVRSEPFRVERLVLFRSRLRRPAPVYEPVAAFSLGGG
jgi:2'-5' RNA ligase